MSSPIDNDDWELVGTISWQPKRQIACDECNGTGKTPRGRTASYEEEVCGRCLGKGKKDPPFSTQPRIPSGLISAQGDSWREYFKSRAPAKGTDGHG